MNKKSRNALIWGILLIIVGCLIVLDRLNFFKVKDYFVETIMFALAIFFHVTYFTGKKKEPGMLVPGGICLVIGVYFLLRTLGYGDGLWPLFLLAPAFGILETYIFSKGKQGSVFSVFLLTALGGIFLLSEKTDFSFWALVGLALMIGGFMIIITAIIKKKDPDEQNEMKDESQSEVYADDAEPYVGPIEQPAEEPQNEPYQDATFTEEKKPDEE